MKLSDFVAKRIFELNIKNVFMVTGGGAMHLNHSFGCHPGIKTTFNHHEQACAIAAESFFRLKNKLAVCNVTSGPGGTNAITGVHGAFVDSIGMLVISGQVKYETTVKSTGLPLRQYGDQELDIINLVKPITKYAVMLTKAKDIKYELEKATYLAKNGRPGPCWIDIPIDIQSANINPDELKGFIPSIATKNNKDLTHHINFIYKKISNAKRPVIYAGNGINLSGQQLNFKKLINKLKIPIVTGFSAHDLIESSNYYYVGRPGTIGDRAGNFAVQNSDLLIVLGSRLNIRQISYNWKSFARKSFIIWVDIDPIELKKPNIKPNYSVLANLKDFIPKMLAHKNIQSNKKKDWLEWCKERQKKYPVVLDDYWSNSLINPYCFFSKFWEYLPVNTIVVTGNATACIVSFQTAKLKKGQRLWSNSGSAMMGYDLPAAIGAYRASKNRPVICIAGDGSIMMNLQELQTISSNNMNIKIFLLNNSGYVSIFQTHKNFFNGKEVGSGPKSGVKFPSFRKIAKAFNIDYFNCKKHEKLEKVIKTVLNNKKATICEIFIDKNIVFAPKLSSKQLADGKIISPPLEDMSPFLSDEELKTNMLT